MSMITCCPACSTLFKVAPEQLQIAGGWVRCGQCMAVFDARARMVPADPYVPPDLDWQEEEAEEQGNVPLSLLTGDAISAQPQAVTDPASDITATDTKTMALTPEPWHESPSAEISAFAEPASEQAPPSALAFELIPPPAPEKPVSAPVLPEKTPAASVPPKTPATDQTPDAVTTPKPALPIPTRDELDRRHAQLLEALARLRENAEKRKRELANPDTRPPGEDSFESAAHNGGQGGRPQQDAAGHDADRGKARHHASTNREITDQPERRHNKESSHDKERAAAFDEDQYAERDSQPWRDSTSDENLISRPMIDFVLSEMSPSLSLPASASTRPEHIQPRQEPQFETKPPKPEVPSFIEQAQRRAFWALPQVRAGLWVAAGVFSITLASQIAVNQRNRLAAQHPNVMPLLQTLCRPARCSIAPWQHLSAVTIDSSAFVRTGPSGFGFAVTLRNSSAAPVATPALELALIDAQDQPLARRVLNPADWGAPPQLSGYGEFNGAALLTVLSAAHPQAVSNYRLTAFYP